MPSKWDRIHKDSTFGIVLHLLLWCLLLSWLYFGVVWSFSCPALNHRSMDLTFLLASSEQTNVQVPTSLLVHKISDQEPINY